MRAYSSAAYLKGGLVAVPLGLFWLIARMLPVAWASAFGRHLFSALGPLTAKHRHVRNNMAVVLRNRPEKVDEASRQVWGTLGMSLAEYPHLERIVAERVSLRCDPAVREMLEEDRPMFVVSGHVGNWEVAPKYLDHIGMRLNLVYANNRNPFVEWAQQRFRHGRHLRYLDKDEALRPMLESANENRSIGLLPDQRVDSGVFLDFFGESAGTTISPARVALRIGYPIVPLQIRRLDGARFEAIFHPPLTVPEEKTDKAAAIDLTMQFNRLLEQWISDDPGSWLCTKRRWPKKRPAADT